MKSDDSAPQILPSMLDLHLNLTEISLFIRRKLLDSFDNGKFSLNQYRVLRFLKEHPHLSLSSLKEKITMKKGNLSRVVDSMVRQNLINRIRDESTDRRKIELSLTPKGEIVLGELNRKQSDLIQVLYHSIPEAEITEFNKVLGNLKRYFDENPEIGDEE